MCQVLYQVPNKQERQSVCPYKASVLVKKREKEGITLTCQDKRNKDCCELLWIRWQNSWIQSWLGSREQFALPLWLLGLEFLWSILVMFVVPPLNSASFLLLATAPTIFLFLNNVHKVTKGWLAHTRYIGYLLPQNKLPWNLPAWKNTHLLSYSFCGLGIQPT